MEVVNTIYMAPNMTTLTNVISQNVIHHGVLIRFVGSSHIYQAPKSNCFIAARAISARKVLLNVKIYLLPNFLKITNVKF